MRRLFDLLTLLLISVLVAHCGGGGTDAAPAPNPSPPAGSVQVTGRVIDGQTQAGIASARVDYQVIGTGQSGTKTTSADGSFSFAFPSDGRSSEYLLDATGSAVGYVNSRLGRAPVVPAGAQVETIVLVRESTTPGSISGSVRNARDNAPIAGARVTLDRGQGSTGEAAASGVDSGAQGQYSFTGLPAGTYTVSVVASGFRFGRRTAITVSSGTVREQNVVLSPEGSTPDIRIVLTWGSTPSDLDAHLTGPNASDAGRFHVSFVNRVISSSVPGAAPLVSLDVDERRGNGPETITITKLNSGTYRYSVHDFTNRASAASTELGRSGAKVELYVFGDTRTFFVPNQSGNLWTVFELSGDIANPTVTERNTMGFAEDFNTIPKPRERE